MCQYCIVVKITSVLWCDIPENDKCVGSASEDKRTRKLIFFSYYLKIEANIAIDIYSRLIRQTLGWSSENVVHFSEVGLKKVRDILFIVYSGLCITGIDLRTTVSCTLFAQWQQGSAPAPQWSTICIHCSCRCPVTLLLSDSYSVCQKHNKWSTGRTIVAINSAIPVIIPATVKPPCYSMSSQVMY